MNFFNIRSNLDRIMSKLQELRRNVGFSLSNQNNLKEWIESIETAFPDKEYMQIMKESIMANNDLSTLILNNLEQVTKSTFRLQGLYGEREKEEMDSSIIFHSKYKYEMEESNSLMPLSANKQDSIDVFLKQENNIDASNLRSPFNTFFSTNEKFFPFESKSFNLDHYSCTRPSENKENLSSVSQISRKRGPYKHYSPSKKRQALDIYYSSFLSSNDDRNAKNSTQKISKSLDIPCNTLKRWIKVGIYRRKGAGRKLLDPLMEEHLYKWCQSELNKNNLLTGREIRKMARNLSSNKETFKASKGWLVGFLKRFKLEQCMY